MQTTFIAAKSYNTAKRAAPWAAIIARVEGGFRAFESVQDYAAWKRQR